VTVERLVTSKGSMTVVPLVPAMPAEEGARGDA